MIRSPIGEQRGCILTPDEFLVSCLALSLSVIATGIALGPWDAPYKIRSVAHIENRFGKFAARLVWVVIAIVSGGSAAAIISGVRPAYATPTVHGEPPR
ncbi:hypothetical protein [Rhodopirellula sallentina]|uniref:Membrane protein n=1 Tax=Rhodopirellula sallentina SM41 TaxID=1263870 RepID=M5U037_9BACT|nr:hypothetical protein [Rhodopirellula sallentina]EMI54810.1 membrane protein [Rhodopirellula sallentina SM41]